MESKDLRFATVGYTVPMTVSVKNFWDTIPARKTNILKQHLLDRS